MEIHEAYSEIRELYEKAESEFNSSRTDPRVAPDMYHYGRLEAFEESLKILEQIPDVIKLSNCPFCGGGAFFLEERAIELAGQVPYLRVQCRDCGVKTDKIKLLNADGERDEETERVAKLNLANAWNKRK